MHIKPKKRLGQNFLVDKNLQRKIAAALELSRSDVVLEIGAGRGELTELIAQAAKKVYAIEIDAGLCKILGDNLKNYGNVKIINKDILKLDIEKSFAKDRTKLKVVGNLPYYITSPIIARLLKFRDRLDSVFITVQKEFAVRMLAGPGTRDYGAFSCFVSYFAQPKILFEIKKTCFFPVPKVDSAFLKLELRPSPPVTVRDEELFFKIIRAAFSQRRKTLKNSLKDLIHWKELEEFFSSRDINSKIRPEALSLQDFADLAKFLN